MVTAHDRHGAGRDRLKGSTWSPCPRTPRLQDCPHLASDVSGWVKPNNRGMASPTGGPPFPSGSVRSPESKWMGVEGWRAPE